MSTYIAIYEEDGDHPAGRLIAASAEPIIVVAAARMLLERLPVSESPIVEELNRGRRRALQAALDVAMFLSSGSEAGGTRARKSAGADVTPPALTSEVRGGTPSTA